MAEWPYMDHDWAGEWPGSYPCDPYGYGYYQEKAPPPLNENYEPQAQEYMQPLSPRQTMLQSPPGLPLVPPAQHYDCPPPPVPKGENPRELRNKAEKQRRDKLNQSIQKLASIVPPVVNVNKKFDKTSVLRFTAHYLRAHQYVFGDSISESSKNEVKELSAPGARAMLGFLNGFLLTTTYRGLIVVVSQNIHQYLGYNEVDLLGQSIFKIIHPEDVETVKEQLMPQSHFLGQHGELVAPNDTEERKRIFDALQNEKRKFTARFKKFGQKSEPVHYVSCVVEGSMRKSDGACRGYNRCCQMVRRARARGDNPYSSGNDIVFIGEVRPMCETFITERQMESFKMEYRTRHSVDGEIIQCEQRIALVTGYMTHEVNGVNAMNFMHRDDVRWVIIALRQMYVKNLLIGESCYRLMTKNGEFIYMRTTGKLDVEDESRAVRTFVCTNTVVGEREGKRLIKMMKKKFQCLIDCSEEAINNDDPKKDEGADNSVVPVENPRSLEKVILHLVKNLPSPQPESGCCEPPERDCSPALPLSIIPPKKERIRSAIEKIYSVIKILDSNMTKENQNYDDDSINSLNVELSNESTDKQKMDFGSSVIAPPAQPFMSFLKTPNIHNDVFNDNKVENKKNEFEEFNNYITSSRPSGPNVALEYVPTLPPHPILKPQPMYAIDQPGPSGVATKRTHDDMDAHETCKKLAATGSSTTIIKLEEISTEGSDDSGYENLSNRQIEDFTKVGTDEEDEVFVYKKTKNDDSSDDEIFPNRASLLFPKNDNFNGIRETEIENLENFKEGDTFSILDSDDDESDCI